MTLITYYLLKIPVSLMNLIINIPLFIIAWKVFGSRLLYSSILGTFAVSGWLTIFEKIPFVINLEGDLVIVALLTGVIAGVGLGIVFNAGGTTGGTDIIARIANKYTNISMGKLMFTVDFCVLIFVILVFKDVRLVTYTLIFVFIASRVIDLISEGGYAGKGFMVITNHPEELAKKIDEDLGRGVTFINGQGYYSENNLKLIYCVVGRNEMQTMKNVIHSVDPRAFITITDAHEILGEGFTLDANKQPLQR